MRFLTIPIYRRSIVLIGGSWFLGGLAGWLLVRLSHLEAFVNADIALFRENVAVAMSVGIGVGSGAGLAAGMLAWTLMMMRGGALLHGK
jgi:hypothetical protein